MFSNNSEDLAQKKLLLLYLIENSPQRLNKEQLVEYLLSRNYMNFFSIQVYLDELLDSEFINLDEEEKYKLSNKGQEALTLLSSKLEEDVKLEIQEDFNLIKEEEEKITQVQSEYYVKENGQYTVNIRLVEKDDILFSLYLEVASQEQAELISKNWKEKPDQLYANLISVLIE